MGTKVLKFTRTYLYLIPVIVLFGIGVLSRTATSLTQTEVSASATGSCKSESQTGLIDYGNVRAMFEGRDLELPTEALAEDTNMTPVLGVANPSDRWIEVDLSEQKLRAWDGKALFLETAISTGLSHTPTPKGEFRVWMKLRATKMEGGQGKYYYYLPNVPYVMFFENASVPGFKGYGLHGTYWHSDFGTPRSHGCVNLPTPVAKELYFWTSPVLADGKSVVRASNENQGTRIVIHE